MHSPLRRLLVTATALLAASCGMALVAVPALASPPEAATREATAITGTTATLNGELNPDASGTDLESEEYQFAYAPSTSECTGGVVTPEPAEPAGGAAKEAEHVDVTGLEASTEYTFCVIAINTPLGGTPEANSGAPLTFKTLPAAPKLESVSSSSTTPFEENVEALVNPENQPTTSCMLEYGKTLAYGKTAQCAPATVEGTENQPEAASLASLEAATTYHYRFVAENTTGTSAGPAGEGEFTTSSAEAPTIDSESASAIKTTSATLTAAVDANDQDTHSFFQYATTATTNGDGSLTGATTAPAPPGTGLGSTPGELSAALTGLASDETYYYQDVATNATGTSYGPVQSFATVPVPHTDAATAVTATGATLHGHLTLGPAEAKYSFDYNLGSSCTGGSATPAEEATATTESEAVTGLQPNATYSVCFVTSNASGGEEVDPTTPEVSFKTLAARPTIEREETPTRTLPNEEPPNPTSSEDTVEATVNPNNETTTCEFEYGTDSTLATHETEPCTESLGSGGEGVGTADVLKGLEENETYYFRVAATNVSGTTIDPTIEHFKTVSRVAPRIESENASEVTPTSAKLEAQVKPYFEEASYSFEYAQTEASLLEGHGTAVSGGELPAGSIAAGFGGQLASAQAAGLAPNRTYFYHVVAKNTVGTAPELYPVAHFTTSSRPRVSTGGAQSVTATTATLTGSVTPDALPTGYYIEYGGTIAYGKQSPTYPAGEGSSPVPVAITLGGLEPDVTYHYRVVAGNEDNGTQQTEYGEDKTFTTGSAAPALTGVSISSLTQSTVTVAATLDPQNLATRYELELGESPQGLEPVASGGTASLAQLSLEAGSLSPGTLYYYEVTATNADGTSALGGTFTTSPAAQATSPIAQPPTPEQLAIPDIAIPSEPTGTPTGGKPLTNAQKLAKALKLCKRDRKKSKRASCEKQARKRYPVKSKKK